jgi:hypothetical protein
LFFNTGMPPQGPNALRRNFASGKIFAPDLMCPAVLGRQGLVFILFNSAYPNVHMQNGQTQWQRRMGEVE